MHVLVNNSGTSWGAPFDESVVSRSRTHKVLLTKVCHHSFPEQGWDKVMALNVKSAFYSKPHLTSGLGFPMY